MILLLATFFLVTASCVAEIPSKDSIKEEFMNRWWQTKDEKTLDECFFMSEAKYIYLMNPKTVYYGGSWDYGNKDNSFDVTIDDSTYQISLKQISSTEWKISHSLVSFNVEPCTRHYVNGVTLDTNSN